MCYVGLEKNKLYLKRCSVVYRIVLYQGIGIEGFHCIPNVLISGC